MGALFVSCLPHVRANRENHLELVVVWFKVELHAFSNQTSFSPLSPFAIFPCDDPLSTTTTNSLIHEQKSIMFKSILPSKKIPDSEFFMVTPQAVSSKENYPAWTSNGNVSKPRIEKSRKSKGKDTPVESVAMEEAFDKLLVSCKHHGVRSRKS